MESSAFDAAERIRNAIEEIVIPHGEKELKVTVSIGAACFPTNAMEKKALVEVADQAMYMSKDRGRNQTTVSQALP